MASSAVSHLDIVVRLVRASGEPIDMFQPLEGEPLPITTTVRDIQLRLMHNRKFFIGDVPASGLSVYGPFARKPVDNHIMKHVSERPLEFDVVLSTHSNYVAGRTNYFLVCVPSPISAPAAGVFRVLSATSVPLQSEAEMRCFRSLRGFVRRVHASWCAAPVLFRLYI